MVSHTTRLVSFAISSMTSAVASQTALASYKMDEADAPRKRLLDCPEEILVLVAAALTGTPTSLLAFGAAARSLEALLLLGPSAPSLARRASGNYEISGTYYPLSVTDALGGVATYRAALRLRAAVADRMQIVQGSVAVHVAGIGVVPCSLRLPILKPTYLPTHSLTTYRYTGGVPMPREPPELRHRCAGRRPPRRRPELRSEPRLARPAARTAQHSAGGGRRTGTHAGRDGGDHAAVGRTLAARPAPWPQGVADSSQPSAAP
eukprot:scaffold22994_cov63-Phaeocystis_antarctica.AAC.4